MSSVEPAQERAVSAWLVLPLHCPPCCPLYPAGGVAPGTVKDPKCHLPPALEMQIFSIAPAAGGVWASS